MIYIIAFLIILAILILLFSVRIFVNLELSEELKLNIWAFGFRIKVLPKKEKKYRLSDYTPRKIARREAKRKKLEAKKAAKRAERQAKRKAKRVEQKKLSRAERRALKKKKRESRPAVTDMITSATGILGLFFSTFFSHLHIKTSRIKIKVGGPDAAQVALRWYAIYAACDSLIAILDRNSHIHGKKSAEVSIEPDYLSEKIDMDIKVSFSMNLFGILCVLIKVIVRAITEWLDIQPQQTTTTVTKSKSSSNGKSTSKGKPQTKKS